MVKLSKEELKSTISDSMSTCDSALEHVASRWQTPEIRASCFEAILQSKIAEKVKEKE